MNASFLKFLNFQKVNKLQDLSKYLKKHKNISFIDNYADIKEEEYDAHLPLEI